LPEQRDTRGTGNRSIKQLIGASARVLPEKSHGWFREWFRKVWKVRGGGMYALGFALSFIYFEIASLGDDIMGIGSLFSGQAVEFVIQFFIDSLKNTLKAFVWPLYVVQLAPPWGLVALGVAFAVFTRFLKAPIEHWLFPDAPVDIPGKE
jgi:hypothetical protein